MDPDNDIGFHWGGGQWFRPENVSVASGNLRLKLGPYKGGGVYYSGGIRSKSVTVNGVTSGVYGSGYAEWYAKLPGYDDNGDEYCEGMWPALWAYFEDYVCEQDEIDLMDPGAAYHDEDHCSKVRSTLLELDSNCDGYHVYNPHPHYAVSEPLYDNYHKFAYEWIDANMVAFYFDDIMYLYDNSGRPELDMRDLWQVAGF